MPAGCSRAAPAATRSRPPASCRRISTSRSGRGEPRGQRLRQQGGRRASLHARDQRLGGAARRQVAQARGDGQPLLLDAPASPERLLRALGRPRRLSPGQHGSPPPPSGQLRDRGAKRRSESANSTAPISASATKEVQTTSARRRGIQDGLAELGEMRRRRQGTSPTAPRPAACSRAA